MSRILIIDDDIHLCRILSTEITYLGHETMVLHTLQLGYAVAMSESFDVVFLDVRLPDGNGLDILPAIRGKEDAPELIIMTGAGDPDGAETAIKNGAWDYIKKPSSLKQMTLPLIRALEYRRVRLLSKSTMRLNLEGIIGSSAQIKNCIDVVAQAANSDVNVIITGNTGTGKELFAAAIHRNSKCANGAFVVVDCGAMTETLAESTLFGHEKGAFTGANTQRTGLLKTADHGTLFLDEVGELSLNIQRSLLRALQERCFRPVGSDREVASDFRLIAATNRDLDEMVQKGSFREDLMHRLRGILIRIPPLREREGDLRELAIYFVARICDRFKIKTKGISPDFLDVLSGYPWPGNVRELIHVIEQVIAHAIDVPILYPEHLPIDIRASIARSTFDSGAEKLPQKEEIGVKKTEPILTLKEHKKQSAGKYLDNLIRLSGGDIKKACRLSGLPRSSLYLLLKTHHKTFKS